MEDAVFMQNRNRTFGVFYMNVASSFYDGCLPAAAKRLFGTENSSSTVETSQKKKRQVPFCIFGQVCYIPWMRYLVRKPVKGVKKPHETKTKNGEHPPKLPPLSKSAVKMQS